METKKYIEQSLYKGKVKVKFFPESHQYWIDGKRKLGEFRTKKEAIKRERQIQFFKHMKK